MAHLAHYREAHPLPFVITHWINLVCMILLILTGFCIHFPFGFAFMGVARGVHIFCGALITINCLVRVAMAFFVESAPTGGTRLQVKDIKTWLPQDDNKHQGAAWVKYYLFLKRDHPLGAKLGVPQKISYILIPFLIVLQAITGFCLWAPVMGTGFAVALNTLVGGVMIMRIIHYFLMYVFIIFMFIHIYLANIEGFAPSMLMFFWKEHEGAVYDPVSHTIVGHDDLGKE